MTSPTAAAQESWLFPPGVRVFRVPPGRCELEPGATRSRQPRAHLATTSATGCARSSMGRRPRTRPGRLPCPAGGHQAARTTSYLRYARPSPTVRLLRRRSDVFSLVSPKRRFPAPSTVG